MEWLLTAEVRAEERSSVSYICCVSAEVTCPPLDEIANGKPIYYDYDPDDDGNYPFGTEASFECLRGYKRRGPPYSVCYGDGSNTTGMFSYDPPTCECKITRRSV